MAARILLFLVFLASWMSTSAAADPDADALSARFLAHMEAVAPVGGTFTVETRFDPESRAAGNRSKDEWAASHGWTLDHGPDETVLRCEWAWDGERESLRTLDGSNKFAQFFSSPEAFAEGMAPKNYNLKQPDRPTTWRPASFYLLGGRTPWSSYLSDCRFSTRPAPDDAPPGSIVLVGTSRAREVRLLLDESTGLLHGHEIDLGGEPYARLVVDRVERSSGGRSFPASAHLTIYLQGRPHQFMSLAADRITFRPNEVAKAMPLILPAGTRVHDRVLKRVIPISRPTSVESIVANKFSPEPAEEHPLADLLPVPAQPMVSPPAGRVDRRSLLTATGVIAVLASIGAYSFFKGARSFDRSRPSRP